MKKILATLALALLTAAAATDYKPTAEECKTLSVFPYVANVSVSYKQAATFPNPPVTVSLKEGDSVTCPDLYAALEPNKITVKGAGIKDNMFKYSDVTGINLHYYSYYKYPTLQMDLITVVSFIRYDGSIKGGWFEREVKTSEEMNLLARDMIAGYKLNGGEMKPLIYDNKIYAVPKLGNTDKLEIFVMPHPHNTWQKIVIDRANDTVELYKKFDFPK